jgi:hypothetical protein
VSYPLFARFLRGVDRRPGIRPDAPSKAVVDNQTAARGWLVYIAPAFIRRRGRHSPPVVADPSVPPFFYTDAPLFYLSDAPLTVGPCPMLNPTTHVLPGCPTPLASLPAGGVVIAFSPNPGYAEGVPPLITVEAPDASCRAVGGEALVFSATTGVVVNACLRGPDLTAHEGEVRAVINSLKLAA